MSDTQLPSQARYRRHLEQTSAWLLRSIEKGNGGSCAHFSPLLGWSKPYPETTGYLIPTLLQLETALGDERYASAAAATGQWLLQIQGSDGSWHGGLHPNPGKPGSVFNTGQILKGMMALYRRSGQASYLDAAQRGTAWLLRGMDANGLWPPGDYQAQHTPSYYTHVAWPMLEVWSETGEDRVRDSVEKFLRSVLQRRRENGAIAGWGFTDNGPAFTHTIAYTLRGFQECARLLDNYPDYGQPMEAALEVLMRKTELKGGRLAGEFDENWSATGDYVCLTGNAQLAICLLLMERRQPDLRIVNAAAKLLDFVGHIQRNAWVPAGMQGAVAGSYPLWGRYMRLRYPNWAGKYFCDALLMMQRRLTLELENEDRDNRWIRSVTTGDRPVRTAAASGA